MLKRGRKGNPHFVGLRVGLFFLGAGLWVAGVVSELAWLTGAAIGVLAVAVGLRFLAPGRPDDAKGTEPEEEC